MEKIGLFYGPEGGSVEKVARMIKDRLKDRGDLLLVKNSMAQDLEKYRNIIFGISTVGTETWAMESPSDDWARFMPELRKVNHHGKTYAIYGLGDHITYSNHFADAMGVLGKELLRQGARIVGQVPVVEYEFDDSEAVIDDHFIGLPLDEDYESEKTPERLDKWLANILKEFS
ncbi:MAG TPA: flavodoxin [Bacteroidetes bacterium]|nr:flavodoxin [Bacteroidota bacterium]